MRTVVAGPALVAVRGLASCGGGDDKAAPTTAAAPERDRFDLSRTPEAITRLQEPSLQTALANVNRYGRSRRGIS